MQSGLTPAYDSDAFQVVLKGLPTGPAGEASIVPASQLELVFDRADGHLARVVVDTGQPHRRTALADAASAALTELFGQQAPAVIRDAATHPATQQSALCPDARLSAAWSRLARLQAAHTTSPVPASPLWAAEAAQVAEQAGLHRRAHAAARRAAAGLAELLSLAPPVHALSQAALAVADLVEQHDSGTARQLRQRSRKLPAISLERWLAGQPPPPTLYGGARGWDLRIERQQIPNLQWLLDPTLVEPGQFRPGLSPLTDLIVRPGDGQDSVIVEALLATGADRYTLSRCRARLVDPSALRVLASAPFVPEASQARAELISPFPIDELKQGWVEVVDDNYRPVWSEHLRRLRQAQRWADAALRAEQRPRGLAPQLTGEDWASLAALAWERCSHDWEDTGDPERALLAKRRHAVVDATTRALEQSSTLAADITVRPLPQGPAFLAEAVGR
jgi:hypothetical protein